VKFKVTKKVRGPKNFKREVQRRVRAAATIAGRAIADGVRDTVLTRIPPGEKWLDLYREAIQYLESRDHDAWAVAGLSPTALTTVPAESTQIKIKGGIDAHVVANILAQHNPWTVDTLPAVSGGIPGEAEVRPASVSEMDSHRQRLAAVLAAVIDQLQAAGAQITGDFPEVSGQVFIDLVFLQMRLEHGLGGFPRVPHWLPAARQAANRAREWVGAEQRAIEDALAGKPIADPEQEMSRALETRLEKRRAEGWS